MSESDPTVRAYRASDLEGVRGIYGVDDSLCTSLMRFPGFSRYLADSMSHYTEYEPESTFVAVERGEVSGALTGAVDSRRCEEVYEPRVRRRILRRFLAGRYGWPGWSIPLAVTEWVNRKSPAFEMDLESFPAHLHIGIRPDRRRRGLGSTLMESFESYLRDRGVPGYHLYCSSFHPLGLAFYRKLGLAEIGTFRWRIHDGVRLMDATERVFVKAL